MHIYVLNCIGDFVKREVRFLLRQLVYHCIIPQICIFSNTEKVETIAFEPQHQIFLLYSSSNLFHTLYLLLVSLC